MLTGHQIRTARQLLGWQQSFLAQRCKLEPRTIHRAESVQDEPPITTAHARAIQRVLENAGVVFEGREAWLPDTRKQA
jgi:ribosome-binding protein aMBF1 (putative translation factor)